MHECVAHGTSENPQDQQQNRNHPANVSGDHALCEGAVILASKGVNTSNAELCRISRLFDNDNMALALLGNYLREVHHGDPAKLDTIPIWIDPVQEGRHVRRMLAAYERWLRGTPEMALVALLSAVKHPLSMHECQTLAGKALNPQRRSWFRNTPPPAIFAPLRGLTPGKYALLRQRLTGLDLLAGTGDDTQLRLEPIVWEYFNQQIQIQFPETLRTLNESTATGDSGSIRVSHNFEADVAAMTRLEEQLTAELTRKNWRQASLSASRLCQHHKMLGNLPLAVQYARQGAAYASLCADQPILRDSLHVLLPLLHAVGDQVTAQLIQQKLADTNKHLPDEFVA